MPALPTRHLGLGIYGCVVVAIRSGRQGTFVGLATVEILY